MRAGKSLDGRHGMIEYRKLSNGELQEILSVVDPRMGGFAITDETRETAIAMLEFAGAGRR